MPEILNRLNKKKVKDLRVLTDFVSIFCQKNHAGEPRTTLKIKDSRLDQALGNREIALCHDCNRLLSHGIAKLLLCPYNPKPACKKCNTHCYAPGYRDKMRRVMRFTSLYLIKRGRLDLLIHYLF